MTTRILLLALILAANLCSGAPSSASPEVLEKSLPLPGEVFRVQGRTAFVIFPQTKSTNSPFPWVWYAPTLPGLPGNEEKWMFERFSQAGVAIAGIDVGESYGSPDGRALYSAFYDELTQQRGFAPKAVLLGRSRGGLMTLSWAAENPDKVAGFAGIYPVCSIASYPGVTNACAAYHLTAEELSARLAEHNPIGRLAALAKAGVPLFAIHGDSDKVVPLEANSGEMRTRYEALGGRMQLLVPPGQGHSFWPGFFQCQELVDFVLSQAKRTNTVDFRYSPPEWQTAICLPDDPQKSLVDRSGELLYHYGQGGREFATRVGVEVAGDAVWEKQELLAPRVPIVRTFRRAGDLEIIEEAFAVTSLRTAANPPALRRLDAGGVNRNWAHPPGGADPSLGHIAVHMGGSIQYEVAVPNGAARRVALALCEGWWKERGKRVQVLHVEGALPKTVDTAADLGPNRLGAFWFAARDANGDGRVMIAVEAAPEAADKNTILNGLWIFPEGAVADSEALLAGKLNSLALARLDVSSPGGPPRNDMILVRVTNTGAAEGRLRPRLVVDTRLPFDFKPATGRVLVNAHETVTASLKMTGSAEDQHSRRVIQLESLCVPAGKSAAFFVLYSAGGAITVEPATLKEALTGRERAAKYWERAPLPFGRVTVPDAAVQGLVDSSIRNIWQAREIKQGLPVFQVGPTCYRGLWIVDGAFLLEAAALVGAGLEARNGIAFTLSQQRSSGAFEVLDPRYFKENGIVLWTCARHAMLTQDKAWLESVWPQLEKAVAYIAELRRRSRENETPLDDGLNPPGEIDGGLSGHATGFKRPEFSNVHWNLVGLRASIQAAHWLGRTAAATRWQQEYDDLAATFCQAAARDTRKDPYGYAYVPIFMANEGRELPQRAQWTFCHAVYPGQIFAKDDPLVASTLAMLQATEREGMVYGTGWDATGIWNYFASFYGHAWLWQGNGPKAAQALVALANHASPTLVWREEQSLKGEEFRKVGDMPHNWASAEFIRLTIHLLALDRGDELHLLEGFPREWAAPGMVTRLDGVATPFGPLHLKVAAHRRGARATLSVKPLATNCKAIIVHLPGGGTERMDPRHGGRLTFAVPQTGCQ